MLYRWSDDSLHNNFCFSEAVKEIIVSSAETQFKELKFEYPAIIVTIKAV